MAVESDRRHQKVVAPKLADLLKPITIVKYPFASVYHFNSTDLNLLSIIERGVTYEEWITGEPNS